MVALLADLPITTVLWLAELKILEDAQLRLDGNDLSATPVVRASMKRLEQILFEVSSYVENQCNLAGIATLAAQLNISEHKERVITSKPDTYAENTNQPGVLLIEVNPKPGARKYNLEITKVTESGNDEPVLIDSLTSKSGLRDGFERGALYMIRSQPVFGHDAMGPWSEYFLIRIA